MKIKRSFDLVVSIILLMLFFLPMVLIAITITFTSKGPIIYWSERVGLNNKIFRMPKFRTMVINTPAVATHLMDNSDDYLTPLGRILRKYSLDELPQLFSVLKGDMSFVGPRPALFNQYDLISLRSTKGVDSIMPGITGWAQINGRDNISINKKVDLDIEYLNKRSFLFDLLIIKSTISKVIINNDISH
jgi:O-antigen biosynthesis protein WbqP